MDMEPSAFIDLSDDNEIKKEHTMRTKQKFVELQEYIPLLDYNTSQEPVDCYKQGEVEGQQIFPFIPEETSDVIVISDDDEPLQSIHSSKKNIKNKVVSPEENQRWLSSTNQSHNKKTKENINCKTKENTLVPTTSSCSSLKNVDRKADLYGEVQRNFLQHQTSSSTPKCSQKKKSNTQVSSTASSLENLIKLPPENLQNPSSVLSFKTKVPTSSPPNKKKIETELFGNSSSNQRRVQFTPLPAIPHTKQKYRELRNLDCTFLEYRELFKNMEPITAPRHKMATDDFNIRLRRSPEPTAAPIKRRRMTCSDARKTSLPPIKLIIRRSTSTNEYAVEHVSSSDGGDEFETSELPIFPEQSIKPANIPKTIEATVGRDHPVLSVSGNVDKNMTIKSSKNCALCNKHFHNSINLTDHYVVKHKTESYVSRLSVSDVERLENNIILVTPCNNKFIVACIFCKDELEGSFADFYAHYTFHTGEYSFKCEACEIIQPYESDIRSHQLRSSACSKSKIISTLQYPSGQNVIHLYVCKLCNFVQLNETNIKKHQRTQHGFEQDTPENIKKFAIAVLDGENAVMMDENGGADMISLDEFPLSAEQEFTSEFPLNIKDILMAEKALQTETQFEENLSFENHTSKDVILASEENLLSCLSPESLLEKLHAPNVVPSVGSQGKDNNSATNEMNSNGEILSPEILLEQLYASSNLIDSQESYPKEIITDGSENNNSPTFQNTESLLELFNAPNHTASPVHEDNENIEEAVKEKPDFSFIKNETTPEKKPRQLMVYRHTDFNKSYFGAFKCMQKDCWFSSNVSESFKNHMASHEQLRRKKYSDCSYCQLKCPNVEKLIRHVMARHAMSYYQCPECTYRSMIPGNVIIHRKFLHPNSSNIEVYECGYMEKAIKNKMESIPRKMLENTSSLKCPDCPACYYALSSIKTHIHREHALPFDKFDSLGLSELACIHCSKESNCKETMQTHLALEHPGYVVERKLKHEFCEDSVENLRMIDVSLKVLPDNIHIPVFDELEPEPPKIIDLNPIQTTELINLKLLNNTNAPDCSKIPAHQVPPEKIIEIPHISSVGNKELVSLESNATATQSFGEKEKESIEPCIVTEILNQLLPDLEISATNETASDIEVNQDESLNQHSPKKANEGMSKQSTDTERLSPQAPDDCENESIADSECLSETASAEGSRVQYLLKLLTENTGTADSDLYKCSKCSASFFNFELWLLHVGKSHKVDKVMPCPYCSDQLELEKAKHHFEGHRQHKYICFHCIASFSMQEEITEHFSTCHSEFTSVIQNWLEIENECFYFDQNSEDSQTDFTETLRQFASAINLHLVEQMQRNMISEWASGLSPDCLEEVDLPSYLPNGDHKCPLQDCPFIGSDENEFDKHISEHELPRNMTCPDCMAPLQADTWKDIKNHYVLHRATMLHICCVCKFFHHKRYAITEHIESFHNSRDVPVLSVRRGSPTFKISLSIVVSQNKTSFKECFCCSEQVLDRNQLINHLRKQHSITMSRKCELCDKVLITVKEVELHSKEHDEQKFKLKYEVMTPCLYNLVDLTMSPLTLAIAEEKHNHLEVDVTSPKRAKLDDVPIIEESVVKTDVEESSNGNCNDTHVGSLKCVNVDQLIQANQSEKIPISEPIAIDLQISRPSQVDEQCYGASDVAAQRTNIQNIPQTNMSQNLPCHQVLQPRADLLPVLPPFEASLFSTSIQSSTYTHSNCPQTLTNYSQTTLQITNLSTTTPASVIDYQTSSYTTIQPMVRMVPLPTQTTPQQPPTVSYIAGQPMVRMVPLPTQTTPQQPRAVSYTAGQPMVRMVPLPTQTTPQQPQTVSYTAGRPMERVVVPLPSQTTPQQPQAVSYTAGQPMERVAPLPTQTTPQQPQTVSYTAGRPMERVVVPLPSQTTPQQPQAVSYTAGQPMVRMVPLPTQTTPQQPQAVSYTARQPMVRMVPLPTQTTPQQPQAVSYTAGQPMVRMVPLPTQTTPQQPPTVSYIAGQPMVRMVPLPTQTTPQQPQAVSYTAGQPMVRMVPLPTQTTPQQPQTVSYTAGRPMERVVVPLPSQTTPQQPQAVSYTAGQPMERVAPLPTQTIPQQPQTVSYTAGQPMERVAPLPTQTTPQQPQAVSYTAGQPMVRMVPLPTQTTPQQPPTVSYIAGQPMVRMVPLPTQTTPQQPQAVSYTAGQPMVRMVPLPTQTTPQQPQAVSYTAGQPMVRMVPLPTQTTPQQPQTVSYTAGRPMERVVVPLPSQTTPQLPQAVSYTAGQPMERVAPLPTQTIPQQPQTVSYTAGQPMERMVPLPTQTTPQKRQAVSYTAGQPVERVAPLLTQTSPQQPQAVSNLSFYESYNPNIPEIAPICAYCDLECSDFYKLKMHHKSNHAIRNERFLFCVKRKIACIYCSFTGAWDSFKLHFQRFHPGDKVLCQSVLDPTRCGICNQVYRFEIPSNNSLKLHTMVPCGCPIIVRTLADCLEPQILKSLTNIGLPAYMYPCKLCTESFVNQQAFSQHIVYVHNRNDIQPKLCEVKNISLCFVKGCGKSTGNIAGMIEHVWLSHRPWLCHMGTFEDRWKSCYSCIQIKFPLGFVACIGDLMRGWSELKPGIRTIEEKILNFLGVWDNLVGNKLLHHSV